MSKKTETPKRKLPKLQVEDLQVVSGGQKWDSTPGSPPNWSTQPGGNSSPGWPSKTSSMKKK
jgi:hypothetical protein